MSTVQDLQGKINSQSDKIAQLEADVNDLVSKAGGTAPPPSSGVSITQDQVDSMANAIDANNARIDKLKDTVVNGPATPPPSSPDGGTPEPVPGTPDAQSTTNNMNPETQSNSAPAASGGVQSAPIDNPTPPSPVTPGPGPMTSASPSASGGVVSGNADTPQSQPPVTDTGKPTT